MTLVLIATIAIGLGAAGLALGFARLTGGRAPRYLAPFAAGAAMFVFMLWNEYSWFDRAMAALPPDAVIAQTYSYESAVQPWTLAVPRIVRFVAVDMARDQAGAEPPDQRLGNVVLAARFEKTLSIPHLFDCAGRRRAALSAAGSTPDPGDWIEGGRDDALISAACSPKIVE